MDKKTCCCQTKIRTAEEKTALLRRLARIEGQIRGIAGMVENDCYCVDILTQSSAANAALHAFNKELLAAHIKTCVTDDIRAGSDQKTEELIDMLHKLMK